MSEWKKGDFVTWKWAGTTIYGEIEEVFEVPVTKEIKGKLIKRNGSAKNPATVVRSIAGNIALKLASELSKADQAAYRLALKLHLLD